jgi:hypothetical protein
MGEKRGRTYQYAWNIDEDHEGISASQDTLTAHNVEASVGYLVQGYEVRRYGEEYLTVI